MRGRRRGTLIAVLETAQPRHFGPQDHDLAEDEEDADDQHAQNDGVERRRVHEHAHQVRQQENEEFDPEDINYNTFRWITAGASFAMGPSRVNPRTGQILDADIIFDGDFLQFWRREYENFTPQAVAVLTEVCTSVSRYLLRTVGRCTKRAPACSSRRSVMWGRQ